LDSAAVINYITFVIDFKAVCLFTGPAFPSLNKGQ